MQVTFRSDRAAKKLDRRANVLTNTDEMRSGWLDAAGQEKSVATKIKVNTVSWKIPQNMN